MAWNSRTTAEDPQETGAAMALGDWGAAIDYALNTGKTLLAMTLARHLLERLPRHLPTYQRLVQATWVLRRWQEGAGWALRLLQADPGNAIAWAMVAMAGEQQEDPQQARACWLRAFEQDPYNEGIRAGLNRTASGQPECLQLSLPCLASLYRRGRRWSRAGTLYRSLCEAAPARLDLQCGWLESLWQGDSTPEALALARRLVRTHRALFLGWLVLAHIGDEDDRALAQAPVADMDGDGEYARLAFGHARPRRTAPTPLLFPTPEEVELLYFLRSDALQAGKRQEGPGPANLKRASGHSTGAPSTTQAQV